MRRGPIPFFALLVSGTLACEAPGDVSPPDGAQGSPGNPATDPVDINLGCDDGAGVSYTLPNGDAAREVHVAPTTIVRWTSPDGIWTVSFPQARTPMQNGRTLFSGDAGKYQSAPVAAEADSGEYKYAGTVWCSETDFRSDDPKLIVTD